MKKRDFEKAIEDGYSRLPEWVRNNIKNVTLLVENEPSEEERAAQGLADDETLLGLYKGIPLSERGENYGVGMTMPDTITLYKQPILDAAEEELADDATGEQFDEKVRQIVADTVWHEFAHHFGMDEDKVRSREHKRDAPR